MEIGEEAVIAQNNRFSGIKRYDRADFDKWFADYNVRPSQLTIECHNNLYVTFSVWSKCHPS